ncbi:hypothetical protein CALCODRAFT_519630 [Calocera cornea HHB12733]|uniref:Uncharacterized protein n=1 Tax=Calocera cornea HHB12733 TaxID=1353952 RepID=A0A165E463_9BASI|nr:hypothetical protein CALCODRAFT_519630 [Calocera cornea HHB12733]
MSATPKSNRSRTLLTIYGDSFVGPFTLLKSKVNVCKYKGATAKGLNNEDSKSQTGTAMLEHLARTRPETVLLIFGHVDIHVTYLYKVCDSEMHQTEPPDPDTWVKTVFESYANYLREKILPRVAVLDHASTCSKGFGLAPASADSYPFISTLYLSSVTMPVVPDSHLQRCNDKYNMPFHQVWRDAGVTLAQSRSPTDIATRRKMTADFNHMLEEFCTEHSQWGGVRYLDINPHITSPETGDVLPKYLVLNPSTIHVVWETTIGHLVELLSDTGLTVRDITVDLESSFETYEHRKLNQMMRFGVAPRTQSETGMGARNHRRWPLST